MITFQKLKSPFHHRRRHSGQLYASSSPTDSALVIVCQSIALCLAETCQFYCSLRGVKTERQTIADGIRVVKILPQRSRNTQRLVVVIQLQSGLPGLYLIFSPVPVATRPHQRSPWCYFDEGLFLAFQDGQQLRFMSSFFFTQLI